jgi:hypothetical protein
MTTRTGRPRIPRGAALLASLAVASTAVSVAYAAASGLELGLTKPKRVADGSLTARARKLDAYAKSLRSTLAKHPPRLPAVPRYPTVAIPTVPPLPAIAPSRELASDEPSGSAEPTAGKPARPPAKIRYVRPAPLVQVVQPPPEARAADRGDDDHATEQEDHEEHGDGESEAPSP